MTMIGITVYSERMIFSTLKAFLKNVSTWSGHGRVLVARDEMTQIDTRLNQPIGQTTLLHDTFGKQICHV